MEYKLLRALSIVLQAGLVILLVMLCCLFFVSCKPATQKSTAKSRSNMEAKKDIMEQRFLNEMQKHRLSIKVLCFQKQATDYNLSKTPIFKAS